METSKKKTKDAGQWMCDGFTLECYPPLNHLGSGQMHRHYTYT
uniref:Uncharacterized protein n=1 Tax=Rhizophora mucronata TaxID=61149 RepID=A0A2P2NJL4_RHIMU